MKFTATILLLTASPALALNGGYLSSMGGGSAMKASSYMPNHNGYKYSSPPQGTGSYLEQFSAPPASSSASKSVEGEPVIVAINQLHDNMNQGQRTTIDVLKSINANMRRLMEKAEAKKNNGGSSSSYRAPESTDLTSALESSAGAAPNTASYLQRMGGGAPVAVRAGPKSSYAPTKRSW